MFLKTTDKLQQSFIMFSFLSCHNAMLILCLGLHTKIT